ncbi:MAG TPA: hypothetical protein PKK23_20985 [Nitrospirales bacterium]|nr:hypothetical protein [Nitrospirales bacterium]
MQKEMGGRQKGSEAFVEPYVDFLKEVIEQLGSIQPRRMYGGDVLFPKVLCSAWF